MAVYLSLSPSQALVKQSLQRALDAEISFSISRNIAVTCLADRVGSTLLRGTTGVPTFVFCSGVIGKRIIGRYLFWGQAA